MPLLSIVIVNYNYGRYLKMALDSVLEQIVPEVELIVVDGGSTDDSVEIIKKYADQIAWWCSEPDRGQSDAFNKGFAKARGRYLTWLNADDILVPGAVNAILRMLRKYPDCEWFTGNFYRFSDADGRLTEIGWGPHIYPAWMQRKTSPIVVFGPSAIFSKDLWARMGKMDVDMHLMMDTDMWMRFIVAGVKQKRINHFIWGFRMHEDSKTAEFGEHKLDEKRRRQFAEEASRATAKTGYRCSGLWYYMVVLLRILDGSLMRRYYYMATGGVR